MTTRPLVSVITITYNHRDYIERCLSSVLEQKYTNWEMIVVDDGSKDGTTDLVKSYCIRDERIKLIEQENIGVFKLAQSYNKALQQSKGKYIGILEGDDLWKKDKLEKQVHVLESNELIVLSWGRVEKINGISEEVIGILPAPSDNENLYYNNPPGTILNILAFENPVPAVSILIRKSALEAAGGFKQCFNLPLVDLPTILELSLSGSFYFHDDILGCWREFGNQITKTYPVEILKGRWDLIKSLISRNDFKKYLTGPLTADLENFYRRKMLIALARSGRYKLLRKDFRGARRDYLKALFYPGVTEFTWRLRALTGLIFGMFRMDIESLAGFLGKQSYKTK